MEASKPITGGALNYGLNDTSKFSFSLLSLITPGICTNTGAVYACGDNKSGQCGVGTNTAQILKPTRVRHTGAPIVKVGCGAEFSMILDCNGALHSFGLPEYGQLGHNTDGKYFVTSTKLSFHFETVPKHVAMFFEKTKDGHVMPVKDVDIVDFSCGNNHTHALFRHGIANCALFLFGQTKRTGEANMYPKPVQDLHGWNIRSIGCSNTSIVIAADDSVIAWGVSPTYGELGTGEINKSTARPKEVTKMEGLNVTHVAMGYSHSLLLCDDANDEVKQKLETVPLFEP
ncbi:protein RCC2-like [Pectinophora gossypiella]|uniref:protein RCC2-like n=1 Tax=Pectinophora gossypiella TaxID=13191 RepID=UPI00214E23EC|nr:protein RCC2-like [Pectinophora gossypiella]